MTGILRLLLVQPWFTAAGHPPQSTLNTARVLQGEAGIGFLVSADAGAASQSPLDRLRGIVDVRTFAVRRASLRWGTLGSVLAIVRLVRGGTRIERVLFMDGDPLVLALTAGWIARVLRPPSEIGLLYLWGPEQLVRSAWRRRLLRRLLTYPGVRLFLRTEELADAWRRAFPGPRQGRIDVLASMEVVDHAPATSPRADDGVLRLAVIGQLRPGKGLEWLFPMLTRHDEQVRLTVAGAYFDDRCREALSFLTGYRHLTERYLDEPEMLGLAADQHYLLALYDDWDSRMEAATLFLAARAGRPVIVYDEGWSGRMVREFGCGLAVPRAERPDARFFASLPKAGEARYDVLLEGVERFRAAHAAEPARKAFLDRIFSPVPK